MFSVVMEREKSLKLVVCLPPAVALALQRVIIDFSDGRTKHICVIIERWLCRIV